MCYRKKYQNSFLSNKYPLNIHVNLTGVKEFCFFHSIIFDLNKILFTQDWCVIIDIRIDNITASFNFNKQIDLKYLKQTYSNVKYNSERFPGLFFKFNTGTAILFSSGKINIVGCKNTETILELWKKLLLILNNVNI